ncbi:MAG: metal-dependent hydrolase [Bacteroidetes bacterium 46-16]|nr:MAG: metal-dependent hydrolase [Bacteroidetes bacterium 46-16]
MTDDLQLLKYPIGKYEKPASHDAGLLQEWMAAIDALPSWLDVVIENLDEAQLQTPYRPGGWTVNQVVHHLADSHMNAYVRFKLALTEDNPQVKPYMEAAWAELPDNFSVPLNVSVTLLHALHRRWGALMRSMSEADWQRTYYHPEYKRNVPLWEVAALYAWHSRHHMEHIRTLKERMNW